MMKKLLLSIVAVALLAGGALWAQDLTGNWQGTLKAGKDLRMILVVSKEDGRLQARLYSIDEKRLWTKEAKCQSFITRYARPNIRRDKNLGKGFEHHPTYGRTNIQYVQPMDDEIHAYF